MTTEVAVENIPAVTHGQLSVITTELLANLYGTETDNIKKNFARNSHKFTEGKHYFKLTGEELRAFKHKVTNCTLVKIAWNVRHLMLWTERGAARHAKMLETDQAWEVFEKLEDCYFNKNNSSELLMPAPMLKRLNCMVSVFDNETGLTSELELDAKNLQELVYQFGYKLGYAPRAYTILPRNQLTIIN